jgi:alpha-glucuronidase
MASGRPLWDELVGHYTQGVRQVQGMQTTWAGLQGRVDAHRHAQVAAFLSIQRREAQWWRDASVAYFQAVSGRPLPAGETAPPHPLAWYQALAFPSAPGDGR